MNMFSARDLEFQTHNHLFEGTSLPPNYPFKDKPLLTSSMTKYNFMY